MSAPVPWLSVVLPVYNGEKYLEHALASVAAQADDSIEVIAIEGGSTDRTAEILRSYESRLPLRVVSFPDLHNWVASSNEGLKAARGEFACFLHQDDGWLDGRLDALRARVERFPNASLFLHPAYYIDPRGDVVGRWTCPLPAGVELRAEQVIERLLVQNFIATPAPIFSRRAAVAVGGLDASLWYTADWDFWLKLAAVGGTVYDSRPLAAYRIHPDAQTIRRTGDAAEFRAQLDVVLARHLAAWEPSHRLASAARRASAFSVEVNAWLAAAVHGRKPSVLGLVPSFVRLGPNGWRRYLRDSRIVERIAPRCRIGLASRIAARPG
ncbi:glycosyltransferase [Paludisphaera borealis]|uniref:GT2 family glycosyltransferase n=1 Tax=Paludisphaera borealis TaxID=1387353 RepID=A0A1U7CQ30_9BACT|nr:glycosyltransferase [Paludisphaera borealis]APW61037.1 GT2 family glycosyltransferase [Paludisphaera borealis]